MKRSASHSTVLECSSDDEVVASSSEGGRLPDAYIEMFSPPRVVPVVREHGRKADLSVDMSRLGCSSCRSYDLTRSGDRYAVLEEIRYRMPRVIGLSPPCTMYSKMQNMNDGKVCPVEHEQKMIEAHVLLDFAMVIAKVQIDSGRKFFFEHPQGASSWVRETVADVARKDGVTKAVFHQCRFGLKAPNGEPMKKATVFMTNSTFIQNKFNGATCQCECKHRPILGRCNSIKMSPFSAIYPAELCEAIADCVDAEVDAADRIVTVE